MSEILQKRIEELEGRLEGLHLALTGILIWTTLNDRTGIRKVMAEQFRTEGPMDTWLPLTRQMNAFRFELGRLADALDPKPADTPSSDDPGAVS